MQKIRGLYKITNECTGLFYIGKSTDIYKRWVNHKRDFEKGTHAGGAFQYDYDLFGKEAFKYEVLYENNSITDIDLLVKEAQLIDVLNPQYNDIGSTFIHNKKCYFYSWLRSICDDIWIRYDKKRMIVCILDKSVIPDIVTPDDIFYHTESLI